MKSQSSTPVLSFLWPRQDNRQAVVDTVLQTGTGSIFDSGSATNGDPSDAIGISGVTDVLLSADAFMNDSLTEMLSGSDVTRLWVEYHPAQSSITPEAFLDRAAALSESVEVIPVSGDIRFLERAISDSEDPLPVAVSRC
jgi:hypothetical protein